MEKAIILLSCPDKEGIVAAISDYIFRHRGNIEHADQHIDAQSGTLFMRIEWALDKFTVEKQRIADSFVPLVKQFSMNWSLHFSQDRPRVALFVSQRLHCLYDILIRYKEGQFKCEIPLIISNHHDGEDAARYFGIDFHHFYLTADNKDEQERKQLELLHRHNIDLVVLARYMQVLTPEFVSRFSDRVINVHHSFLPAFGGKNPYARAHQRGVKIIGATSHYVRDELDNGPIIDQDTVRVSHRDSLDDLVRKGQDLERIVLSRAVKWHLESKILVYNNKTVIFD